MAGTKEGGKKAAKRNKEKYGEDFYANIGRKGGKLGRTGGFHANRELARLAGALGGARSRRGKGGAKAEPVSKRNRRVQEAYKHLLKYQSAKDIEPYLDMDFKIPGQEE